MTKKIKTVAIANRGEVAVRIIRACQDLGLDSVLLHSDVDVQSRAYRMATKKVCIGPAPTAESYLQIQKNIQGALSMGADAIHPGFGFLSENADFAQAVTEAGLVFIGPSASAIRALGDKMACKTLAHKLKIPMVPGYQGQDQSLSRLVSEAEKMGYPVIVKAAAGGGGRGMKILRNTDEASELIASAQREAESSFGSPQVFIEKYLDRAKHIEFQIFGDAAGKVRHLFDRECSVQRRHQKIIEEATSPSLSKELRTKMGDYAVAIAEAVGYQSAGTVEFLLQDEQCYLLEVNTRLQVEHPVTEMVMNEDLVKMQILTADQSFHHASSESYQSPRGHAIECRVYAENPYLGGIPSTGLLGQIYFPEGPGRRYEYGFSSGDEITSYYDPMIAKVVVWDTDRASCIAKTVRVLNECIVFGVHTNIPYLKAILEHPRFKDGTMTTRFIETHLADPLVPQPLSETDQEIIRQIRKDPAAYMANSERAALASDTTESPFAGQWRLSSGVQQVGITKI